jgi:hypothetical protein
MPKPVPWDWAAPRLIPVLAGPIIDPPGEASVRVRSDLGPIVEIGLDLGTALAYVDMRVAERWECSPDQLIDKSLQNLTRRAERIDVDRIQAGVCSGRAMHLLRGRPPWASSLLLAPEALTRLFGGHDQIFAAPTAECLLSFPLDTPALTIADMVVDFERGSRRPLWLDPFVISDGELSWIQPVSEGDGGDDWTS